MLFSRESLVIADTLAHSEVHALPSITSIPREERLPLSFAQQRLWFLAQLDGVSTTYHISMALRLHGPLDISALRRSLDALWARHESLRSVFVTTDGQPYVALLSPQAGLPLLEQDLRDASDPQAQ